MRKITLDGPDVSANVVFLIGTDKVKRTLDMIKEIRSKVYEDQQKS